MSEIVDDVANINVGSDTTPVPEPKKDITPILIGIAILAWILGIFG